MGSLVRSLRERDGLSPSVVSDFCRNIKHRRHQLWVREPTKGTEICKPHLGVDAAMGAGLRCRSPSSSTETLCGMAKQCEGATQPNNLHRPLCATSAIGVGIR